jgi:hypothetical protein
MAMAWAEGDDNALFRMLDLAVSERAAQDSVLWSIFGTFWAANAILIVAIFQDMAHWPVITIITGSVGSTMSLVWYWIQDRAIWRIRGYERIKKEVLDKLEVPIQYRLDFPNQSRAPPARRLMTGVPLGIMIAWLGALVVGLVGLGWTLRAP